LNSRGLLYSVSFRLNSDAIAGFQGNQKSTKKDEVICFYQFITHDPLTISTYLNPNEKAPAI
jgi:hypothetical protein